MNHPTDPQRKQAIQQKLLAHYYQHKREMPWRNTRDPYAIWVSEVMLQQTQVATVIPYYERFLKRFPTLQSLADAPLQDVLQMWEGLGYYSRARNLQKAAQAVVSGYGGSLPAKASVLRELPGIGRYTAGAVSSIAFGEKEPVVDGNVQRVLSRLFEIRGDVSKGQAHERVWQTAKELLPEAEAGDFNQALMELGATVCLPNDPRCPLCPVSLECEANQKSLQEVLPELPAGKASVKVIEVSAVMMRGENALLIKRLPQGLWAEMWEFPRVAKLPGESVEEAAQRAALEIAGVKVEAQKRLASIKHQVTYHAITLQAISCELINGEPKPLLCAEAGWLPLARLSDYPMAKPQRAIANLLLKPEAQQTLF